ncbi:MAG: type II toxin-antitoxin system VapC family toxin [bacterium]
MYLLDTNILSYLFQGNLKVASKLESIEQQKLATCALVVAELFYGAKNAPTKNRQIELKDFYENLIYDLKVFNFDTQSAIIFADLKHLRIKTGKIIGDFDLMISSICLHNNLILVTNNLKDFEHIPKLQLENWTE